MIINLTLILNLFITLPSKNWKNNIVCTCIVEILALFLLSSALEIDTAQFLRGDIRMKPV